MNKRILLFLLIILSFIFIGCNNKVETKEKTKVIETIEETPIKEHTKIVEPSEETPVINEYTVIFKDKSGNVIDTQKVIDGGDAIAPNAPEETGFTFTGWDKDFKNVKEDLVVNALYINLKITISFYDDNDNEIAIQEYNYGDTIVAPDPTKPDTENELYEFIEWDTDFSIATKDLVIHATYEVTKLLTVNLYKDKTLLKTLKLKNNDKLRDQDLSSLSNDKFTITVSNYYTDEAMTVEYFSNKRITENLNLYCKLLYKPKNGNGEGLIISILGDSISTFYSSEQDVSSTYHGTNQYYYPIYSSSVKSYTKTWWWMMIEQLNSTLGINNSWSGSCCYNNGNDSTSNGGAMNYHRINQLGDNGTPDLIVCYIGTNDIVNNFTEANMEYAYKTMLSRINEKYPNAIVLCICLGYSNYHLNQPDNHAYYSEEKRIAYNKMIRKVCPQYDAIPIDWDNYQTTENWKTILQDNLHFNATGMELMASTFSSKIKQLYSTGLLIN